MWRLNHGFLRYHLQQTHTHTHTCLWNKLTANTHTHIQTHTHTHLSPPSLCVCVWNTVLTEIWFQLDSQRAERNVAPSRFPLFLSVICKLGKSWWLWCGLVLSHRTTFFYFVSLQEPVIHGMQDWGLEGEEKSSFEGSVASRKRNKWWEQQYRWCLMSADVGWHIRDKLRPMREHGSI